MQNEFIQLHRQNDDAIREELSEGLLAQRPFASSKYLYDALGSKLFEAICELPEYYPTRTEARIFDRHLFDIAQSVGASRTLIDLGAGNCAKAARLFAALQPSEYVPIDISVEFLRESVSGLRERFPAISMIGVGMDFSKTLQLPRHIGSAKRLFFYPGSSIGNFTPDDALAFLVRVRDSCGADGGLLIGVDMVKETRILNAAYDDALGLTGAFNLNLLMHLNHVLGANFNSREWRHRAFYNEEKGRIEMHLEARRDVEVQWSLGRRCFREGQRIHTENSYKYTPDGFTQLLARAGFGDARIWMDEKEWFMVCYAKAVQ